MICPRCDGQGRVYKTYLPDLGTYLFACDECDACWEDGEEISMKKFADLSTYLEGKGLRYGVSEVGMDYDWDK